MATIEGIGLVTAERLPSVLLSYQGQAVCLLDSAGTNVLVIEKSRRIGLTLPEQCGDQVIEGKTGVKIERAAALFNSLLCPGVRRLPFPGQYIVGAQSCSPRRTDGLGIHLFI